MHDFILKSEHLRVIVTPPRPMVFRVDLTLKHLEKQSAFIVDVLANSTGRTVDILYATLVHRWGTVSLVV